MSGSGARLLCISTEICDLIPQRAATLAVSASFSHCQSEFEFFKLVATLHETRSCHDRQFVKGSG